MDDAWQGQDMAPTGIGIPANGTTVAPGDESSWNGGGRSPGRDRRELPRRSSRSRSPGRDDRSRGDNNPGNNLHVSGLSNRVDNRCLEEAFVKIGRVKKASVMFDPHTRESRGFGFVTMETAEEADAAITALNATEVMGKVITVERARRGRARTPTPGRYYGPPKRMGRDHSDYLPPPRDYRRDGNRRREWEDGRSGRYGRIDRGYDGGQNYRDKDYRDRDSRY